MDRIVVTRRTTIMAGKTYRLVFVFSGESKSRIWVWESQDFHNSVRALSTKGPIFGLDNKYPYNERF